MNTRTITIINEAGKHIEVEVEHNQHLTAKTGENYYCLTCGVFAEGDAPLQAQVVGESEGLREWLELREHWVKHDDTVLLCSDCVDKAINFDNSDLD